MNPFLHLLKRAGSQPPLGTWLVSASPLLAEAAGHAGFDWAVIDMEHGALDLRDVVALLQAVAGTRLVPVVRVPSNDAVVIKRVLDAGATTVLVPMVQTVDEAAAAVAAMRYPPQGIRGMAGTTRASHFGTLPDHFGTANRRVSLMAQIETQAAVDRLADIAAVDGVDALFVGPADLAGSMGLGGLATHARVMATMAEVARRCQALGKPLGTIGTAPELVAQYRAMGYGFLAVDSDVGHFVRSARASIHALRGREADHVHDLAGGTRPG